MADMGTCKHHGAANKALQGDSTPGLKLPGDAGAALGQWVRLRAAQQCHAAWHPPASLPSVGIDGSDRAQKMWLLALVWLDVNKQILNFNPYKGKINLSFYVFQDNLSDHVNSFAKLHRKTECIRNI